MDFSGSYMGKIMRTQIIYPSGFAKIDLNWLQETHIAVTHIHVCGPAIILQAQKSDCAASAVTMWCNRDFQSSGKVLIGFLQ